MSYIAQYGRGGNVCCPGQCSKAKRSAVLASISMVASRWPYIDLMPRPSDKANYRRFSISGTTFSGKKCLSGKVICAFFLPRLSKFSCLKEKIKKQATSNWRQVDPHLAFSIQTDREFYGCQMA
jgi:hypothetical protein